MTLRQEPEKSPELTATVAPDSILPQQLAMVRAAMPAALIAQSGMIAACVVVLWSGPERGPWLAGWAALALAATILRAVLLWSWPRQPLEADAGRWRGLAVAAAFASGAIWGALPPLIAEQAPVEHLMFLGVVLAGMSAGALAALGYLRIGFYAFVLPALLPYAAVMLLGGGITRTTIALLTLLFLASMSFIARTLERMVIGAFRLQQANAALVRGLTHARDEANAAAEAKTRLIASLEESRREAESANQAKSTFLAIMSHELRTPLNAIIGFADVIRSEALGPVENPRYREYIEDIRDSGTHLLELINKILDLSKIEAGKVELAPQRLPTEPTIRSVLRLFREQAMSAGVSLELRIGASAAWIIADERAFKQMLINLISNALKFAPRGTAIAIEARAFDAGSEICVSDQGIGIAPEDIGKAVAPFSQLGDPMTRRHEGTGLGLSLVKALIELHGGSLAIDSRPGNGTRVRLRFPREVPDAAARSRPPQPVETVGE